jgi:hypothetical protein
VGRLGWLQVVRAICGLAERRYCDHRAGPARANRGRRGALATSPAESLFAQPAVGDPGAAARLAPLVGCRRELHAALISGKSLLGCGTAAAASGAPSPCEPASALPEPLLYQPRAAARRGLEEWTAGWRVEHALNDT